MMLRLRLCNPVCATRLHRARQMHEGQFKQEVEKEVSYFSKPIHAPRVPFGENVDTILKLVMRNTQEAARDDATLPERSR
jgi:hypothetical protein